MFVFFFLSSSFFFFLSCSLIVGLVIKCGFQQDFETQKVRKGVYIMFIDKELEQICLSLIIAFTLVESNLTGREISKFPVLCLLLLILHRLQ